jgi:hypothetical protein
MWRETTRCDAVLKSQRQDDASGPVLLRLDFEQYPRWRPQGKCYRMFLRNKILTLRVGDCRKYVFVYLSCENGEHDKPAGVQDTAR